MELADTKNSRVHIKLAKYFFWIMLALFFILNLGISYGLLLGTITMFQALLTESLFFIIFIIGELFLILGIFWWNIKLTKNWGGKNDSRGIEGDKG
ncbi:MAG: hypothetical protein ABID38_05480 [Candidatus Diapherotrites archaeon]